MATTTGSLLAAAEAERETVKAPSQRLLVPWLVLWALCSWAMWSSPGEEVVPYHLIWIGFALAYGFEAWPAPRTTVALVLATVVTGAILVARAATGVIAWEETTEIPLMLLLAVLVMWHVRRRDAAQRRAALLASRELAAAARRERLARLTSHEMRTPLTIATGYVDLLLEHPDQDPERSRQDLLVVRDELGRLDRAGDRLLRMIRLQDHLPLAPVDVDRLLAETAERWSTVDDRNWVVESEAGVVQAFEEGLRACLDTLIENALRYTRTEDTIRLFSFHRDGRLWVGVGDSGPGLDRKTAADINAGIRKRPVDPSRSGTARASADPLSQTGLGIGLVQDVAGARGGRLLAGRSREGGALLVVQLRADRVEGTEASAAG